MHPIVTVLELGPRPIPIGSYGIMLTLALVVGSLLWLRSAVGVGMDPGAVIATLGSAVGASFVGAWALQLLVQWARSGDLATALQRPGLVFFGGLLAGAAGLSFAARNMGLSPLALADRGVVAVATGHALGRLGCLLGGCCHGAPAPEGMGVLYTHPLAPAAALGVPVHPVPLYEAAGLLLLALRFGMLPALRMAREPGRRAAAYLALYCVLRLVLEPLRGDGVRGVWSALSLSTSQWIAAGVLLSLLLWRLRSRAPALAPVR